MCGASGSRAPGDRALPLSSAAAVNAILPKVDNSSSSLYKEWARGWGVVVADSIGGAASREQRGREVRNLQPIRSTAFLKRLDHSVLVRLQ